MACAHPTKYPKSPFEAFMEFKPIVGHFQPWGVIAFALKHKSKKDLLERVELCLLYSIWAIKIGIKLAIGC